MFKRLTSRLFSRPLSTAPPPKSTNWLGLAALTACFGATGAYFYSDSLKRPSLKDKDVIFVLGGS